MSLDSHLPAFSVGISQIPAERNPRESCIKVEEQEPLSAYLPIPNDNQAHTTVQPQLFKAEDTSVFQQRGSQSWIHNENGIAITESGPADQHSGIFKGENDGEFDEDLSNDEETADGVGVSVSDPNDKKRMKRFRYDSDFLSTFIKVNH